LPIPCLLIKEALKSKNITAAVRVSGVVMLNMNPGRETIDIPLRLLGF
jgi:hypothetical protein